MFGLSEKHETNNNTRDLTSFFSVKLDIKMCLIYENLFFKYFSCLNIKLHPVFFCFVLFSKQKRNSRTHMLYSRSIPIYVFEI